MHSDTKVKKKKKNETYFYTCILIMKKLLNILFSVQKFQFKTGLRAGRFAKQNAGKTVFVVFVLLNSFY